MVSLIHWNWLWFVDGMDWGEISCPPPPWKASFPALVIKQSSLLTALWCYLFPMAKCILHKVKSICHRYTVSICQRCSQSFMREPPRCGAHSKEDTRTDTVVLQLGMKSDPCQKVMLDTKLATNLQEGTAFHFRVIFSSGWKSLPFLLDKTIYIVQFLPSLTDGIWVLIDESQVTGDFWDRLLRWLCGYWFSNLN